jgi:putative ATP-binding cassette transporter
VGLYFQRQRYEADFRFSLARLREYSEQIALLKGERAERRLAMGRFGRIFDNYLQIVDRRKQLMAFTSTYGQISPFIPYIVAAPFYFAGKIQLGVMSQTAGAFSRVEGALNFFVTYYTSLADFKAVLDRLSSFDAAIDQAHAMEHASDIVTAPASAGEIGVAGLELALPDGRVIVTRAQLTFQPGEAVLLSGHSGSGKSTLFRAISGVWPFGEGAISVPAGASVMLLPQKPYIPIGTLRNAVTYPQDAAHFDDAALRKALENALMGPFIERLDEEDNWGQRLSGGEQQRLAVARALLAKPDWLFLDEATSALDEPTEAALYRLLADHLPGTTVVSIGHRSTLAAFHQRRIVMEKNADGAYTPVEHAKTAAE